jgi:hypothetical protein
LETAIVPTFAIPCDEAKDVEHPNRDSELMMAVPSAATPAVSATPPVPVPPAIISAVVPMPPPRSIVASPTIAVVARVVAVVRVARITVIAAIAIPRII